MKVLLASLALLVLAAATAHGAPSSIIYSNAEHQSGVIQTWNDTAPDSYPYDNTVMIPFLTQGNNADHPGWFLETIRLWGGIDDASATFQIWEDDQEQRPDIVDAGSGRQGFDASSHDLKSIFSWAVTGDDSVETTLGDWDGSDPYTRANYTYTLDTPLVLAADTIYWFSVDAAPGGFNWRRTDDGYDPAGFDITSNMMELKGSVVPEPAGIAALIGMTMVAFAALWRRRK